MGLKYTLVTGGSVGIGLAIAHVAARNRRNIILTARSEEKLAAAAEELRNAHSVEVLVIPADLSAPGEAARMWAEATSDGREVNFLVNNAGLGSHGPFASADWAREKASMDVNMAALTELCKLAVPHMTENGGGKILNVASTAAFIPGPAMAVYHATKAYVVSLSVALNEELAGSKISVTVLCPGATKSEFASAADMHDTRFLKNAKVASASSVAEAGYAAAIAGRPFATPGLFNKSTAWLGRLLPRTTAAKIMRRIYGTM